MVTAVLASDEGKGGSGGDDGSAADATKQSPKDDAAVKGVPRFHFDERSRASKKVRARQTPKQEQRLSH